MFPAVQKHPMGRQAGRCGCGIKQSAKGISSSSTWCGSWRVRWRRGRTSGGSKNTTQRGFSLIQLWTSSLICWGRGTKNIAERHFLLIQLRTSCIWRLMLLHLHVVRRCGDHRMLRRGDIGSLYRSRWPTKKKTHISSVL